MVFGQLLSQQRKCDLGCDDFVCDGGVNLKSPVLVPESVCERMIRVKIAIEAFHVWREARRCHIFIQLFFRLIIKIIENKNFPK